MKGLEKLTSIRLAEVLTQRGTVETDAITDALYAQDRQGEIFVDVLVESGQISEWDLAKIVVEHFQLPFITASSVEASDELKERFPKELLFRNKVVPLTLFEDVATVALPILAPFDVLIKLQEAAGVEIYPYVGLTSENNRVLGEMFSDYNEWQKEEVGRREARARQSKSGGDGRGGDPGNWMDLFDSGDANVRNTLTDE